MKSDRTMLELATAFIDLAEQLPFEKVTISKIVESCGKNRKTFYYYFLDIDSIIIWVFRHDLGTLLEQHIESHLLIWEDQSPLHDSDTSHTSKFPYYLTNKTGVRTLNHAKFFKLLARTFDNRRNFYSKVFHYQGSNPNSLEHYLYGLYQPAIKRDIEFMLDKRYLHPRNIELLSEFYARALVGDLSSRIQNSSLKNIEGDVAMLGNLIHNALGYEIEELRLSRKL